MSRGLSLRARLTLGAGLLMAATVLTALSLSFGMSRVADRMDAALAAEARMSRYSLLSTRVSTFLVVATEAVQSGLPADRRADRIEAVAAGVDAVFVLLDADIRDAVSAAEALGIDHQSWLATQSLGLARMRALLEASASALSRAEADQAVLRAHIDSFASNFDPLLNQAVNSEALFRRNTLQGIETLRGDLSRAAWVMVVIAVLLAAGYYGLLIHPQFRRLEQLRGAAQRIGQADFAIDLPETRKDEIGGLFAETNRMAAALAGRQAEVEANWAQLNEVIAQRTEALRAANARLEEVDESRRRFFADISHELRTPLTVILMEAQIGRQTTPEAADVFETIETRASRLNRRIDDLLRVARSDSGALALEPEAVPVAEVLEAVAGEVAAECRTAGMTLEVGDAPEGAVQADRNWLRQVLVGLVRNAIRHARDGRLVRVTAEMGGAVCFAVEDNGPGIPAEAQARIFERFAQGTPNAAGFGLGLALAKWVIEEQGGGIGVELRDGAAGTKVAVRLPRADV